MIPDSGWVPCTLRREGPHPDPRHGSARAEGLAGVPVPVLEALPVLWLLLGAVHSCCVDKRLQVQTAMGSGGGSPAAAPAPGEQARRAPSEAVPLPRCPGFSVSPPPPAPPGPAE